MRKKGACSKHKNWAIEARDGGKIREVRACSLYNRSQLLQKMEKKAGLGTGSAEKGKNPQVPATVNMAGQNVPSREEPTLSDCVIIQVRDPS